MALGIGPGLDVFSDSLKRRPAEFELGVNVVNSLGELQVERTVVFRKHVLSVRFLAHLDVGDGLAARFDVAHLRGGVLGPGGEEGNGNNGGKATSDSTGDE